MQARVAATAICGGCRGPVLVFRGVVLPDGSYSAQGVGGQYCLVIPSLDLVIVHRVNTDKKGEEVNRFAFGRLLRHILNARVG